MPGGSVFVTARLRGARHLCCLPCAGITTRRSRTRSWASPSRSVRSSDRAAWAGPRACTARDLVVHGTRIAVRPSARSGRFPCTTWRCRSPVRTSRCSRSEAPSAPAPVLRRKRHLDLEGIDPVPFEQDIELRLEALPAVRGLARALVDEVRTGIVNADSCRNSDCRFSSVDWPKVTQNASDQKIAVAPWAACS